MFDVLLLSTFINLYKWKILLSLNYWFIQIIKFDEGAHSVYVVYVETYWEALGQFSRWRSLAMVTGHGHTTYTFVTFSEEENMLDVALELGRLRWASWYIRVDVVKRRLYKFGSQNISVTHTAHWWLFRCVLFGDWSPFCYIYLIILLFV